ncbi:MAG: hypothetical protein ACLQUY_29415 [Ktedonobacterales bacterium]
MTSWEDFYGRNVGYAVELYECFRIVAAARLARSIREYGHLAANIN